MSCAIQSSPKTTTIVFCGSSPVHVPVTEFLSVRDLDVSQVSAYLKVPKQISGTGPSHSELCVHRIHLSPGVSSWCEALWKGPGRKNGWQVTCGPCTEAPLW